MLELLYEYFASGILDANIRQFGGEECFQQIPPLYHYIVSLIFVIVHILALTRWGDTLVDHTRKTPALNPNLFEKIYFLIGLISLFFACYYKLAAKRGFFLLNPCHITLALMLFLLMTKDNSTTFMRKMHTAWTAWLFGAFAALAIPHLQDITMGEYILYYVEHIIILPLGPLVLYRRYGIVLPSFKNQIASFGSIAIYQLVVLMLVGRWFKINLNFALCHSPQQPFFPPFGYHYYTIETFNLNLISFIIRWVTYQYVTILFRQKRKKEIEGDAVIKKD